jgi:AcrR family transcriptional regulator
MVSKARRERERRTMEEEILSTALAMVRQHGLANLSLRAVAEQMEYSSAALYRYFPDKAALVTALAERGFGELTARLAAVPTDLPAAERILALGRAYLRFAAEEPHFYTMMFVAMLPGDRPPPGPDRPEALLGNSAFALLHEAVADGAAAGAFPIPADQVLPTTYAAWALVHGYAMLRVRFPALFSQTLIDTGLRSLLHSLTASRQGVHASQ